MTEEGEVQPSWRRTAGTFLILALIALWAFLVVTLAEWIGPMPTVVAIAYYAIAGTLWIAPLRPLLMWMEIGKWRE